MIRRIAIACVVGAVLLTSSPAAFAGDAKSYAGETCRPLLIQSPNPINDPYTLYSCPVVNDSLGRGIRYAYVWRDDSTMNPWARCYLTRMAPGNIGWWSITKWADNDGVIRFGALPRYSSNDRYGLVCQGRPAKYFVVEG
jgi:hypothetical protein